MPLALDLFCGAGGASMGLHLAGFEVIGVDIRRQPRYPFHFIQADALRAPVNLGSFDLIWASPPCQAHTVLRKMWNAREHEDFIPPTRRMLHASGRPFVIENVPGPLRATIQLCGSSFGLGCGGAELRRHRHFETNFGLLAPLCQHGRADTIGVYSGHQRNRRRPVIGVHGEGCRAHARKHDRGVADFSVKDGRVAMGIDWMTLAELCEAIPPAYSEFIGREALRQAGTKPGSCATVQSQRSLSK